MQIPDETTAMESDCESQARELKADKTGERPSFRTTGAGPVL